MQDITADRVNTFLFMVSPVIFMQGSFFIGRHNVIKLLLTAEVKIIKKTSSVIGNAPTCVKMIA
jgi:hypothetical protein